MIKHLTSEKNFKNMFGMPPGALEIVDLPKFKCQNISKMEDLEYLAN